MSYVPVSDKNILEAAIFPRQFLPGDVISMAWQVGLGGLCFIFFTHYAIPICSKFYRLCLKLCPKIAYYAQTMLIISGRSKLVCSNNHITLLCTSQFHHQSQTRPSRSYHVKTLSLGAEPGTRTRYLGHS